MHLRTLGGLALCFASLLTLSADCGKQPSVAEEQNPFDQLNKIVAGMKPKPGESARDRCLAKQKARLESCGSKSGQDRAICEAVAKELIAVCEQIRPDVPEAVAAISFCSGTCATTACPTGCKIPGGTGTCLGNICKTEKISCGTGLLFECYCETDVVGPPLTNTNFCSCSCQ